MNMLLLVLMSMIYPQAVSAGDFEPYTYRQDFESRELMAWSSYPPIQDTAYEAPYIYPGKILPDEDGTVLCKILYPQSNNPQLTGVVKRLRMRLDSGSRIRFRYYIKTTVSPSWLGIDFPLADGGHIRARFPDPPVNRWVSVDYGLGDILEAAGEERRDHLDIGAMALTVRFEGADPDMPIELGFDDFNISGSRPVTFKYEAPETESLEEWNSDIALRHYRHGDRLEIRGTFAPSLPERVTAAVSRFDRPGRVVKTFRLRRDGSSWRTAKPITIDENTFPAGMYEVTLTGTKGKETVARSVFTFMVLDDGRFSTHPALWFPGKSEDAFVKRLREKFPEFLESIRKDAADARERYSTELPYDLPCFPTKGWLKSFEAYRTRIATIPMRAFANAVVYAVDGDPEAAAWAKEVLVNLCRWPTWTHPWMVNRGHKIYLYQWYTTHNLALTYDILHGMLNAEERRIVRDAFIRNGLEPAYRTYVVADMVTCNESNWITAVVGGALTAACAVLGDLEDTSTLEPYLSGCLYKLRAHMDTVYGGDSGCIEGFGYGYGTMRHYSEILPIFEETLGLDMGWRLEGSYGEALWTGDHYEKIYYSFGDTRLSGGNTFASFPWLIEKFRDPELAWLYDIHPATPTYYTFGVTRFDIDGVPRKKPELKGAKWFRTTGTVVFRSGNDPDAFIFTFRSGPFGNHQHLDQGTFFLHDGGRTLITEQGYSNYYDDPFYQSHIIQPIGHNCILVDGNIHSQRTGDHGAYAAGMNDHAEITEFIGGGSIAFTQGDLGPLYLGNVSSLKRGVLYIPPRTVLIVDRLRTENGEASMSSLFHGPRYGDISVEDDTFVIRSGGRTLRGTVLVPADADITLDPDVVKLERYTDDPIEPLGRVTVTAETSGGRALTAVLLSTGNEMRRTATVRGSVFAELDGADVLINPAHEMLTNDRLGTDGFLAAVSGDGALLVVEGTHGSIDSNRIVHADSPVTVLVEKDRVVYSSPGPTTIRVKRPGKVRSVLLNGSKYRKWRFDGKTGVVSVEVPAGNGTVEMK